MQFKVICDVITGWPFCVREKFSLWVTGIKEGYLSGVSALSNYKTAPPGTNGTLKTEPTHDVYFHVSDALRTFSEAW